MSQKVIDKFGKRIIDSKIENLFPGVIFYDRDHLWSGLSEKRNLRIRQVFII
jgi:hypothetical protein